MNKNIIELTNGLKTILGEKLISIVLYGSAVNEHNLDKSSDLNLIVIIDKIRAADLKAVNPVIKNWKKTKNPLPLFMGKEEWLNSSDVYPMEYSDIKDRNIIVYGENLINELSIQLCDLRLQCESETKNLLIRLRQSYLAESYNDRGIEELIKLNSNSFSTIFRAILRLNNETVPSSKLEIVTKVAQKIDINEEIFKKIIEFKTNSKVIAKKDLEAVVQNLIDSIYEVLKYVDKLEVCKEENK